MRAALHARTDIQPMVGRRRLVVHHCRGRRIEHLVMARTVDPIDAAVLAGGGEHLPAVLGRRTGSAEPKHPSRGRRAAPVVLYQSNWPVAAFTTMIELGISGVIRVVWLDIAVEGRTRVGDRRENFPSLGIERVTVPEPAALQPMGSRSC